MAVDYKASASYDIIKYIWLGLVDAGILYPPDYSVSGGGTSILQLIPIIPVQEVPELVNRVGDKPYLVYDYSMVGQPVSTPDVWLVDRDEIVFAIYSPDQEKIMEIINYFIDTFRSQDIAARNINKWVGKSEIFSFYHMDVISAIASAYTDEESGRMVGEVVIGYDYARNTDGEGRFI
jgi:hypothetical protein